MLTSVRARVFAAFLVLPLLALFALPASAQVRVTGQVIGTVKDASGAVVANADIVLIDLATGTSKEIKSGPEGGFVIPNLQPGRYTLTATAAGFQPQTIQEVVVETSRVTDVVVQFQVAGVTEQVNVEGRSSVVETSSSTISTTVRTEQIAKLPINGRNVLDFALLTPGAATSSTGRFSTFNGLPGGAINITLDGVNNNSQRFRSGGTSFFVFAPVRLGAMEELTVSTSGLTADAGAEGAVQVQFVTKRGTNDWHGQLFDQFRSDKLNANSWSNNANNLPKAKLKQNEWGSNIGGPIIHNKLFMFANFEQVIAPSQSTQNRTVLTSEAQQGVFRYTATDNSVRTVNVLDIARANGFPGAIDPTIASQLATINPTLNQGTLRVSDLLRQSFAFQIPSDPKNVYPTGRVDWKANDALSIRGVLNLQWRDLARNPQFPTLDFVNAGFTSTYYIVSTGADWNIRPNLFNQASFGFQSNFEEFNPGNTVDVYGGVRRIGFPLTLTTLNPTNDVMPQPRNNPVYNASDTFTWLKGKHTYTAGGTWRLTTMWETIGAVAQAGPTFTLGVATADPVSSIYSATTIPGVRAEDLPNARALYALLTGRVSNISGTNNINPDTLQYEADAALRREAQTVGGLFAQDSWRINQRLTLNYGLRWEFTGAAHNTNGIYTSPTIENLYGPSAQLFRPGTLDGILNPAIDLRPHPYKADLVNPAPNAGFAWNPSFDKGILGKLLGDGKSVIRGSVGLNYYDEGLIAFQTAAGGNPGLQQTISLAPGQPGFPPGGLSLASPVPALNTFPTGFDFPLAQSLFTFSRGLSTIDPNVQTPYIANWNIGIQRELGSRTAIEARYVGNHGFHLWRNYNINEVNIFENGFLDDFKRAQQNLVINQAAGITSFANNSLPGQAATPIFDAAFGARGSQAAVSAAQGYANTNFITLLQQGQAGGLANSLAGSNTYLCRMLGSTFGPCASIGFNAPGVYPINFFQANPFGAGQAENLLTDDGWSRYHGLQLQFRQRYGRTLSIMANYTYAKARTNRYSDSPAASVALVTNRDDSLNETPQIFDLRHAFQTYWTYELPFGRDRHYSIENPVLNQIVGGWTISGIARVQSGRPFFLTSARNTYNQFDSGVVLNGISVDDLQKMIKLGPGPNGTKLFVDPALIGADGRANPQFLQSPTTAGVLGQRVFLYGPGFWNVDFGLSKRFNAPGNVYFNFEALFLDILNHTPFLVGPGSSDSGFNVSINSTTFGQTTSTAGGPRNIQLRMVLGF